jgi:acetyl-CoA carboxylase biotin carboxyl carrier protein
MPKRRPARPATPAKPAPAARRDPTYDDILAIARLIESGSRFSEFRLRSGDIEVEVKRANGAEVAPAQGGAPQAVAPAEAGAPLSTASSTPAANAGNWAPASAGATLGAGDEIIRSPMVGTFYRSPEPGAPPFVEPGTRVEPSTIVCIIEVMKLMNSVAAGVSGVVTQVFAGNAQLVEHGQPLIAIRVDA